MTHNQRVNWYIRVVPAVFLAIIHIVIAWSKFDSAAGAARAVANDPWMGHVLSMLHSLSGGIFFGILGVMILVRKEPIRRERRIICWLLPVATLAVGAFIGTASLQDYPVPVMLVATTLIIVGTGFTIYALSDLGRHYGVVSDVRGLVTNGAYRWVRHPLYGGEMIAFSGLMIAVATPIVVMAFAVLFALQIWRAKVEEQALTAAFPEYREYAARTPMLIPFTHLPVRAVGSAQTVE